MKKTQFYILFLGLLCSLTSLAQNDTVNVLDEVFLTDKKLKDFSTGQQVTVLNDSVLKKNGALLTSALNFNTNIYFKENGLGMVSSPSFRGTTASQTAVLWNGININSQFNGQTDFNTLNAGGFDNISVRGGGGSVIYGTGAIGGTVHLNTNLDFTEKTTQDIFVQYGSFNTLDARYKIKTSGKKWSLSVATARNSSDNDYEWPIEGRENENGEFYNSNLNLGFAYRLNKKNTLKFYSEIFDGERHFSLIRPSETKTKYQNFDTRNLLEWVGEFDDFISVARLAHLNENYKFYGNIASDNPSFGEAQTLIGKYDLNYSVSKTLEFNAVLTNTYTDGTGSGIEENTRNIFSSALLMKHKPFQKFQYELGIRKEITNNYKSPFLFSAGTNYDFTDFYSLKMNISRNFRIPTYNDLYWAGAGNLNLRPETSNQVELGNHFKHKDFKFSLTGYYIHIDEMIRWLPSEGGVWRPINEEKVETYGLEVLGGWEREILKNHQLRFSGTYAYTVSENMNTGYQLIYVPFHKTTGALTYAFKDFSIDYQLLYNGEVFTRSDNNSRYNMDAYMVSNLGIAYDLGEKNIYKIGGRVLNIFDEEYQSVENRWMPGRNFNIYLNLNF
ncbi:TonB-dependent receptor [Salegentibacter salinarum]|uniref:TonB-dependent receptor n=1 Tax=Salegentibacter salinarum TaxID=447422 RepID=A0A2N0TQH2_9FLAO|nr:TonB-dependent receptor [Salegentibacter salinarum]PKD16984.1 TonB-dependent receptor [Salegentibacter salinarum]SKB53324.1 iron complex outermembrane recepter protein [Salegentibacter salinarum]